MSGRLKSPKITTGEFPDHKPDTCLNSGSVSDIDELECKYTEQKFTGFVIPI